jgi:hypothetical protein
MTTLARDTWKVSFDQPSFEWRILVRNLLHLTTTEQSLETRRPSSSENLLTPKKTRYRWQIAWRVTICHLVKKRKYRLTFLMTLLLFWYCNQPITVWMSLWALSSSTLIMNCIQPKKWRKDDGGSPYVVNVLGIWILPLPKRRLPNITPRPPVCPALHRMNEWMNNRSKGNHLLGERKECIHPLNPLSSRLWSRVRYTCLSFVFFYSRIAFTNVTLLEESNFLLWR